MSSIERDTAEALLEIWKDMVALDFDKMSREDLIQHIKDEANYAKSSYRDFAIAYSWYKDDEDFEADMDFQEEGIEYFKTAYEACEQPEVIIRIREWLANTKGCEPYFLAKISTATNKAILVITEDNQMDWIPKSQIVKVFTD